MRTRTWLASFVIIFFSVFLPGVYYWESIHAHWSRCVYGDPVCSLTVSTYLLSVLTLGAFLAAYKAARYAQATLEMEKEVVLSINACAATTLTNAPVPQALTNQGNPVAGSPPIVATKHEPHRCEVRYFVSLDRGFESLRPQDFNQETYGPVEFDCASLGRSALINGALRVRCTPPNQTFSLLPIEIGSIPTDEFIHLSLWIPLATNIDFRWDDEAIHRQGSGHQALIECNARDPKFGPMVNVNATTTEPEPPPPAQPLRISIDR